jgi:hypothetical protein
MRFLVMSAVIAATLFAASPTAAQTYYARQTMSVPKRVAGGSSVPVARCGALVKGDWFVDYQFDTGLKAATLSEAQAACDSYATKGAGTCGWTNDPFYPASFRNKVYWTAMVETRQYNIPSNTEGFVWAVRCPAG